MHVVNCHQNTEAADLLGGLRPLRGWDGLVKELRYRAKKFLARSLLAIGRGAVEGEPVLEELGLEGVMSALEVRFSWIYLGIRTELKVRLWLLRV